MRRKITSMVKYCQFSMEGLKDKSDLDIIPMVSYDLLLGMDWLLSHHATLDYRSKTVTCQDEDGNIVQIQGIPILIYVRKISAM